MERLTNSSIRFDEQVRKELSTLLLSAREEVILSYLVFPAIGAERFSLFLITDSSGGLYIVRKSWDSGYDSSRFASGIYNLDRICIKTIRIDVAADKEKIEMLSGDIDPDLMVSDDLACTVLDGVDYELKIKTGKVSLYYKWKGDQDIGPLRELINYIIVRSSG